MKMSQAFMWVGSAYMKQSKEQLDLPCPEERKISPRQAKPHVWPEPLTPARSCLS